MKYFSNVYHQNHMFDQFITDIARVHTRYRGRREVNISNFQFFLSPLVVPWEGYWEPKDSFIIYVNLIIFPIECRMADDKSIALRSIWVENMCRSEDI